MIDDHESLLTIQQASLLTAVERAANGHRRYNKQDMERLIFLNYMRLTGMPLDQMRQYADLHACGESGVKDRIAMLQRHRSAVAHHVEELNKMLAIIDFKLSSLETQVL